MFDILMGSAMLDLIPFYVAERRAQLQIGAWMEICYDAIDDLSVASKRNSVYMYVFKLPSCQ
jgi:hypothetical protein